MNEPNAWQASWALLVEDVVRWMPKLVSGLVLFVVGMWLASFLASQVDRALRGRHTDQELRILLVRVVRIGLASVATVLALQQVDFDLTGFVAGLGIVGVTVGFALQDVAKNLVAGRLLLVQQPFEIGDAIEVSGQAGVVTSISLRATELRTFEGLEVLIPNADVYAKVVRVFGHILHRRQSLTMTVGTTDVDAVAERVLAELGRIEGVVADRPGPRALVTTMKEAQSDLAVWFWIDVGRVDELEVLDRAIRAVRQSLLEAGVPVVSIACAAPFPDAVGGVKHVQEREG